MTPSTYVGLGLMCLAASVCSQRRFDVTYVQCVVQLHCGAVRIDIMTTLHFLRFACNFMQLYGVHHYCDILQCVNVCMQHVSNVGSCTVWCTAVLTGCV